jgi:hypothetical protein
VLVWGPEFNFQDHKKEVYRHYWHYLNLSRNAESQVLPETYWIRIYIIKRMLGSLYAH